MNRTIQIGDMVRFSKHDTFGESDHFGVIVRIGSESYEIHRFGDPENSTFFRLKWFVKKLSDEEALLIRLEMQ